MRIETKSVTDGHSEEIRTVFDTKTDTWQYSIPDVIAVVADTTDARNYWKSLKNRLKKSAPQLVTNCNQLKLPSSDGKNYATDTTDAETILEIVKMVSPLALPPIKTFVEKNELPFRQSTNNKAVENFAEDLNMKSISINLKDLGDAYSIEAHVAGIAPEAITFFAKYDSVTLRYKREEKIFASDTVQHLQELSWGSFSRTVLLPSLIEVDAVEAFTANGMLYVQLPKLPIDRIRPIKVRAKT